MASFNWSKSSFAPQDFLYLSTPIEELSYTPSTKEKARDDGHLADTGRRSWRTLKGQGEAVWPPLLEAALLEALECYGPDSKGFRINRSVGRFRTRNLLISDYIRELTGKIRTPKQVGSRLQRLRETCKGDKLKRLLGHHDQDEPDESPALDGFNPFIPSSLCAFEANRSDLQRQVEPIVVHVRVYLREHPSYLPPTIQLISNFVTSPQTIWPSSRCCFITQQKPLVPLSPIFVQFASQYALTLDSSFTVYSKTFSRSLPSHVEIGQLKCLSSPVHGGGFSYGGEIVPEFWESLRISTDISKYTVVQLLRPAKSSDKSSFSMKPVTIVYTFALPPLPPTRSCYPLSRLMDAGL